MKKRLKLKGWVKVVLSLVILGVSVFVYSIVGAVGQDVSKNTLSEMYVVIGWFWLIFGQVLFLMGVWEN